MKISSTSVLAFLLSLQLALPVPALAQEAPPQPPAETPAAPLTCDQQFERAQRERLQGHYIEARNAARACSSPECPAVLINECVKLFEVVQTQVPSVVFAAHDRKGNDLVDVRVDVDGVPRIERLDGRPVELDPGSHTFRFEAAGLPPYETKQTVRVGEQNRVIEAILGEEPPPAPPAAAAPSTTGSPTSDKEKSAAIPAATYLLGGVGILALGGFGYLRLSGMQDYDELEKACAPKCDPSEGDEVRTKLQLSYAALGLGVAALGGAVLVYVVSRPKNDSASLELRFDAAADRGTARVLTRF